MEVIPWNGNPIYEIRYKHLNNGVNQFMPLLGPTCNFCKSPIQDLYMLCEGQDFHDQHYTASFGCRLGGRTLHN